MFGYVKTDYPNLIIKDTVLYQSMYCGLCKAIGKSCGNKGRFCLNYDLTFLSVLLHNYLNFDVKIEKERCIIHWFKKRPVAKVDALSERIGALNVILAYHKCADDVLDEKKGGIKKAFFKKPYKKAVKKEPELDKIVSKYYKKLIALENANCDSIDMVADPFGNMMQDIVSLLVGEGEHQDLKALSYGLGKWIYLIDALDDFDKDLKKGSFNVFRNAYKSAKTKEQLLNENRKDFESLFGYILSDIIERARTIRYNFNHDLTDNILFLGLNAQTKKIMENCKCKNTTKY